MIVFPNCKINLGLHIIGKRADGFHDLQTVFYPVFLQDALEVITGPAFSFSLSGIFIKGNGENICQKAYELLKNDFPQIPTIKIHLHKTIPIGAGLGGGSADGAFMLQLLNKKYDLNLTEQQLIGYALKVGSDCPFFIINKPCIAAGRGEQMQEIYLDLSAYKIIIVNPGIHINTGWAFSLLQPKQPQKDLQNVIQLPINQWKDELKNDFEEPVFAHHPEIKNIKEELYTKGAVYASMSGSGSTVYGLFKKEEQTLLSFPSHYFVATL